MTGEGHSVLLGRVYSWLAPTDPPQQSDVIFVLAGRECRKHFGLRLFEQGCAARLLLSVGRFEVRRFSSLKLPAALDLLAIAFETEPRRRHYFVCIQDKKAEWKRVEIGWFGTFSEICAFSDWLRADPSIRSAMVVSSGFHLRRVRMCCRNLVRTDPKLTFVSIPEEDRGFRGNWWRNPKARKMVLTELAKLPVYKVLVLGTKYKRLFGLAQTKNHIREP